MTGKNYPSYNLNSIKLAFKTRDKLVMTYSAMQGQYALGFSDQDVIDAIQALRAEDFYKSMQPAHAGFSNWQDVYKSTFRNHKLYIKFQMNKQSEIIISFKAR